MIAVDSNVLVAAHRGEHSDHSRSLSTLATLAAGDRPWAVPVFCLGEFLRIVTHPKVFQPPSQLPVALDFLAGLLKSPTVRLLSPGQRFWPLFRETSLAGGATGNLIFDAQIAALCQEHGALDLLTFDRDFARFPALRTRMP